VFQAGMYGYKFVVIFHIRDQHRALAERYKTDDRSWSHGYANLLVSIAAANAGLVGCEHLIAIVDALIDGETMYP